MAQLHLGGMYAIFNGSRTKLDGLGKTPLKSHHAPAYSIELHFYPPTTPTYSS
jgi:hypothetical protein